MPDLSGNILRVEPLFEASIHGLAIAFCAGRQASSENRLTASAVLKKHKQQSYIDTFFNLCTYMNEHCTEDLSMDELAEMTDSVNPNSLSVYLKEFAGVSYYEYLTKRRLLHAELLLIIPSIPLLTLPCRAALTVLATFNRVFKSSHNCTPTDYRKETAQRLPDHQETPFTVYTCLYKG